ncbi:MAG: hypothetical protein ACRCX2_09620 [Paraclostridium sp.]
MNVYEYIILGELTVLSIAVILAVASMIPNIEDMAELAVPCIIIVSLLWVVGMWVGFIGFGL